MLGHLDRNYCRRYFGTSIVPAVRFQDTIYTSRNSAPLYFVKREITETVGKKVKRVVRRHLTMPFDQIDKRMYDRADIAA